MIKFFKNLFKPSADLAGLIHEGAIIIDVRSRNEYQAGHIQGSRNIPLDKIGNEAKRIKELHKPVVTVCQSGTRSRMARSILTSAGVETYNGGGWLDLKRKLQ